MGVHSSRKALKHRLLAHLDIDELIDGQHAAQALVLVAAAPHACCAEPQYLRCRPGPFHPRLPCPPGDEAVDALVQLCHEAREGLSGQVPGLALHVVLQLVLPLPPPLQRACGQPAALALGNPLIACSLVHKPSPCPMLQETPLQQA